MSDSALLFATSEPAEGTHGMYVQVPAGRKRTIYVRAVTIIDTGVEGALDRARAFTNPGEVVLNSIPLPDVESQPA